MDRLQGWLPRALLLMVVWGSTVFLWGTFSVWAREQYVQRLQHLSGGYAMDARQWFDAQLALLKPLAEDSRLQMGLDLPAGVKSLPVQRALYEYSYLHRKKDIYAVELTKRRVGTVATAAPLGDDVLARLSAMRGAYRVVLGTGQHNGQILLGLKVHAPLPQQVFVLLPVNLDTMAADGFLPTTLRQMEVGLVVPHTSGWAWWRSDSAGFSFDPDLSAAMDSRREAVEKNRHFAIMTPLPGLPVMLGLRGEGFLSSVDWMPHMLVALWAVLMSLMIIWVPTRPLRLVVMRKAEPVMKPVMQAWVPVQGMLGNLADMLETHVTANLRGQWREAQGSAPLVDGPGHFDSSDFKNARDVNNVKIAARNAQNKREGLRAPKKDEAAFSADEEFINMPKAPSLNEAASVNTERERKKPGDSLKDTVIKCIKEKRIALVYQPIYRVDDDMPVMHEVYVRLVTPAGRTLLPSDFLPLAQEHKLTLALDLAVFERVLAEHFDRGVSPVTPLALNISSTSLDGVTYLKTLVGTGPGVLQKIAFEVRSQEMVRDPKALNLLKEMQNHGGHLAVDYFGGGHAMLEASRRMGFDYVKLDCTHFTGGSESKKELIRLCQSARELGLAVILEKVGSQSMLAFARRVGAPYLQGYALSVPLPTLAAMGLAPQLAGMAALANR